MDALTTLFDNAPDLGQGAGGTLRRSRAEAEAAVRTLICWAGDDPGREGLADTPDRVLRAYLAWLATGTAEDDPPRSKLADPWSICAQWISAPRPGNAGPAVATMDLPARHAGGGGGGRLRRSS